MVVASENFRIIFAITYPVTLKDVSGRTVTINHKPKNIALAYSRGFPILEILYGNEAGKHVVAWGGDMKSGTPGQYHYFIKKYPNLKNIPELGYINSGGFNTEKFIEMKNKADILIVDQTLVRTGEQTGIFDVLQKAGIPVISYDFYSNPVKNTVKSIETIGIALDREKEVEAFKKIYDTHLKRILTKIKEQGNESNKKTVFIERAAGMGDSSLRTYGNADMGTFIPLLSAENVMTNSNGGNKFITTLPETVIGLQPDLFIMQTSSWKDEKGHSRGQGVSLGYPPVNMNNVKKEQASLLNRRWFKAINAKNTNNVHVIWMNLHNSPYNIIAIDYFAKWIYPNLFKTLNPNKTFQDINFISHNTMMGSPLFVA